MINLRVNKGSLSAKVKQLRESTEFKAKGILKDIAQDLADVTPVDTGAYAESFSVGNRTRSRTSKNRPRNQSVSEYRGVAYNTMASDIDALDFGQFTNRMSIRFRNRAPHARYIEGAYQVFGRTKDINR